ncbi:hypothetical protein CEP54_001991 [Fusarium duplospermum]|uniref:Uncharacterized protein n=1 Tax=Fusarium duplospermum TaxID=1325734 RepID=A0A428QX81_9HYPO|nr:hypothetical protein CEP54_001991 [Fusarium duplospermum]
MAVDSAPSTPSFGINDLPSASHSSMLLPFIHDTSSFSDRQVQVANDVIDDALSTMKGREAIQCCPNDMTNHNTKGRDAHKSSENRSRDHMFGVVTESK